MIGARVFLTPLLVFLVFAASAVIVWLAHIEAGEMTVDRRPPLVKASTSPLKRSPDDPGGSTVAELGGVGDLLLDQPAETEERLLPRPEQPVTPEDAEKSLGARAALEALISEVRTGQTPAGDAGAGGPNPDDPTTFPSPSKPGSTSSTTRSLEPPAVAANEGDGSGVDNRQARETELAGLTSAFEAAADGRYRVQLAAVREEEDAKRAWSLFKEQLGPYVSGLQPFFERAETSNGIFYRVQIGPFGETSEADRLCAELKKQNASCFVVTR
jgi:cell division septation protein DedD